MKSKTCLFGGSFDPPHIGHLVIAQTALEEFGFDRVIFIPAFIAPHKQRAGTAAAAQRLAMTGVALRGNQHFKVSDFEIKAGRVSYSHETVRHFRSLYPKAELYFLIGLDLLPGLPGWKELDYLLENVTFITGVRAGHSLSQVKREFAKICDRRLARLVGNIFFIPQIELSSSLIKEKIKRGESIKYLVPEKVERYINEEKIYR